MQPSDSSLTGLTNAMGLGCETSPPSLAPKRRWKSLRLFSKSPPKGKPSFLRRSARQSPPENKTKAVEKVRSRSAPELPFYDEPAANAEAQVSNNKKQEESKAKRFQQQRSEQALRSSLLDVLHLTSDDEVVSACCRSAGPQDAVCRVRRFAKVAKRFTTKLNELHKSQPSVYGASLLSSEDITFWMEKLLQAKYASGQLELSCRAQIAYVPLDETVANGFKDSREEQTLLLENLAAAGAHNDGVHEPDQCMGGQGMFVASLADTVETSPLLPLLFCPQKRMRAVSKAYVEPMEKLLEHTLDKALDKAQRSASSGSDSKLGERLNSSASWLPRKPATQRLYEAPDRLYDNLPEGTLCEPTGSSQDLPLCAICLTEIDAVEKATQISKCGHCFHSQCLHKALRRSRQCPVCRDWIGGTWGKMPTARMVVDHIDDLNCAGFETGTMVITFVIPEGIQKEYHENPGVPYDQAHRIAFVPACPEGYYLVNRLQIAFTQGLTCTIGTSPTTGLENSVVWSSIPLKLHLNGSTSDSFPDENYFETCNRELDALGVPRPDKKRKKKRAEYAS